MEDSQRRKFVHSLRARIQDKNHEEIAAGIVWAIENYFENEGDPVVDQDVEPKTGMPTNPSRDDLERFKKQIDDQLVGNMNKINKSIDSKFGELLKVLKEQNVQAENLADLKSKGQGQQPGK